jgi:hypothetical protein
MTDEEREKMRVWVNNWKETGEVLERLRREEICSSNLEDSIEALDGAFKSAIFLSPVLPTSGLIEFHRILSKKR